MRIPPSIILLFQHFIVLPVSHLLCQFGSNRERRKFVANSIIEVPELFKVNRKCLLLSRYRDLRLMELMLQIGDYESGCGYSTFSLPPSAEYPLIALIPLRSQKAQDHFSVIHTDHLPGTASSMETGEKRTCKRIWNMSCPSGQCEVGMQCQNTVKERPSLMPTLWLASEGSATYPCRPREP